MTKQIPTIASMEPDLSKKNQHESIDHKQLEEALWQRTARRFQSLIENSNDIVLILDSNARFRYLTPSTTRVLGYVSEEMIGEKIFEFVHPEDIQTITFTLHEVLAQPGFILPEVEYRIRHKDGNWHIFAATFTNLIDEPAVEGILVNSHDITARKQAEAALRQSEELLSQVVSSITDHIYVIELTEAGQYVNRYNSPNIEMLTGYPFENVMADRGFWRSSVIHPDDRAVVAVHAARLNQGQDSQMEYRLLRADGKTIWIRDSSRVQNEGMSKLIFGVVSDITERKQIETQFRQSQKLEAIGRLAGGVTHDFNNLLTVILGNCDFILEGLSEGARFYQEAEQIKKAGKRAASLTSQLLAVSRKQVLKPEVLDLNTVVRNMEQMLRHLIGENITVNSILAPDLGHVRADPSQMEQVIMNLAINARDAMPEGGKLTFETANVDLDELYAHRHFNQKPGPYVMLALTDTGHGMDEETQERIFEPFFTTKEQGKGTGLGLATVQGIINQSDGHIWVYSELGHGTTFKIYMPRIEELVTSIIPDPVAAESFQATETVLLVEDEDMIRELARRVLLMSGYTVLEACHAAEALQVCERNTSPIDLIITDIVMPGELNGFQLVERLKTSRPEMQVIYMSGYPGNTVNHYGFLDPNASILEKPFTLNGLKGKVQEVLGVHQKNE